MSKVELLWYIRAITSQLRSTEATQLALLEKVFTRYSEDTSDEYAVTAEYAADATEIAAFFGGTMSTSGGSLLLTRVGKTWIVE
jgi:hypothetical protein